MKFLQSNIAIEDIDSVRLLRRKRVTLRTEGLALLTSLTDDGTSGSLVTSFQSFASALLALEQFGDLTPYRHYLQGLSGCDNRLVSKCEASFKCFFNNMIKVKKQYFTSPIFPHEFFYFLSIMLETYDRLKCAQALVAAWTNVEKKSLSRPEFQGWKDCVCCVLRALAFDYSLSDHSAVHSSPFLPCLNDLLCSNIREIRDNAWALLEVMLPRCVGLIGQSTTKLETPTDLSKSLSALVSLLSKFIVLNQLVIKLVFLQVMSMMEKAANSVSTQAGFSKILSLAMGRRHEVIPGAVSLDAFTPGLVRTSHDTHELRCDAFLFSFIRFFLLLVLIRIVLFLTLSPLSDASYH